MTTAVARKADGKWVGSGNPKGRPRTGHALAEAIRNVVDPHEMAKIAWDLAQGKAPVLSETGAGQWSAVVEPQVRLAALNWLATHGYIKPATQIETTRIEAKAIDFSRLPAEEIALLDRLIARAAGDEDDGVLTPPLLPEK